MVRDGNDLVFAWTRRTRVDGDAWELVDVPLGEESEAYALDIFDGATLKRSISTPAPAYRYADAQIIADFGSCRHRWQSPSLKSPPFSAWRH
ncbi:MAG: hypothetical protein HC855_08670 [Rhizobiales bacterium]|nr:hypothetical protein [Hyphomicrobiales bacterium]